MKTKLMSCLFCLGVGLFPSVASSMDEEVQSLIVHQSNKRALSGIVTDATTNEPLIGVSILIKGTHKRNTGGHCNRCGWKIYIGCKSK